MTGNAEGRPAPACTAGVPRDWSHGTGRKQRGVADARGPRIPRTKPGHEARERVAQRSGAHKGHREPEAASGRGGGQGSGTRHGRDSRQSSQRARDETRTSTLFRNEGKSGSPSGGRWRGRTGRCAGTACLARHAAGGEDGTDSWRFTWHRIALVNYQVYSHRCHSITPEGLHKTACTRPTPGRR